MFKELAPVVAERDLHIVLKSGKDGKIIVYVEPAKKEEKGKEGLDSAAHLTPLTLTATPAELDDQLGATLADWVKARQDVTLSLNEALAASKKLMEDNAAAAKKEAANKAAAARKSPGSVAKPAVKPAPGKAAVTTAPPPSLLDDGGKPVVAAETPLAAPAAPVAATETAPAAALTEDDIAPELF